MLALGSYLMVLEHLSCVRVAGFSQNRSYLSTASHGHLVGLTQANRRAARVPFEIAAECIVLSRRFNPLAGAFFFSLSQAVHLHTSICTRASAEYTEWNSVEGFPCLILAPNFLREVFYCRTA